MSKTMTIQGRDLSTDDIEFIRHLIKDRPDWNRTRLSKHLCQLWDWRTDTGLLKDMACRSMLRKLEQREFLILPPAQKSGNRARRIKDIEHDTDPIQSSLRQIGPVEITMITGRGDTDDLFHCLMDRYHYLGCHGHVGEHIKYMAVDSRQRPLACLLFGSAAWKTAARDRFIGWDIPTRQANLKMMTNNTRFLILPWVQVKNLASYILAACVRRLRHDWHQRYGHDLCLVETFVDRSRFIGTCYRAANWLCIGQTKGRSRQDRHKKLKVPVKDLYVYPRKGPIDPTLTSVTRFVMVRSQCVEKILDRTRSRLTWKKNLRQRIVVEIFRQESLVIFRRFGKRQFGKQVA